MEEGFDLLKASFIVFVAGLVASLVIVGWIAFIGPLLNQTNYNNFNTSPQHLNAVAQKFSDDCRELATTTNPIGRAAIENDIYSVASTVDITTIQMSDITRLCVKRAIQDVTGGK